VLTIESLVEGLGLELAAGRESATTPVRWVHITELTDPTPWLSGGELLLTTGIQLRDAAEERAFVKRLAGHGLAGLGFGTGFDHEKLPQPLVDEARKLGFPVFEVPYELPFIAITEKAFTRLVNEQYEVLQRGTAIHRRLERLVIQEGGLPAVVDELGRAIGGTALVLDARGHELATAKGTGLPDKALDAIRRQLAAHDGDATHTPVPFVPEDAGLGDRALVLPVATGTAGAAAQAWLVAARTSEPPGAFERLLLQQAVTVVALELMRQRTVRDTERRLAGDVLAEALGGRLDAGELEARLAPFGIRSSAAVLVFSVADPSAAELTLDRFLSEAKTSGLVAQRGTLLCAVVDVPTEEDALELARDARSALLSEHRPVRAAASRPAPASALRRSFHEARCALEATALAAPDDATEVASHRDLGAFQLLLSIQDDDALRLYCDSVLGPLRNGGDGYSDELVRSLEVFIEQNGNWERAARELYCHRHTLRYRIRKIEDLTGRDLSRARDRIEFWLALRGSELVT
jgi:purine catabolism regulator